ncbi:MAG: ferritin family protein [Candidatus Anammoxibacter sp.]
MEDLKKKYRSYNLAIKTEEDGYNFYKEGAAKAKNRLVKETFKSFAEDEQKHMVTIEKFYNSLEKNEKFQVREMFGVCSSRSLAKSIFERADEKVGESVKAESDVVEPYKMASKLESDGIEFYKNLSDTSINESEKELYSVLMEMEMAHKEILDNMIEYLDNPGSWFFDQERWSIEG